MEKWNDVHPRVAHCFLSRVGRQTGADRCESYHYDQKKDEIDGTMAEGFGTAEDEIDETPHAAEENIPEIQHGLHEGDPLPEQGGDPKPAILAVRALEKNLEEIHHVEHNENTCMGPCGQWMSTPYVQDDIPEDNVKLKRRYEAIPEEYYTNTGLHPVTPHNFKDWFARARGRGLRWHAWEICSGSGRLSLILLMAGLVVGFPVDYRYGWDINNLDHQKMLWQAQQEFQPGYMHFAPDCAPWSVAGTSKDPMERLQERKRDWPGLSFIQGSCEEQSRFGRGYGLEQPLGSAMWQALPENPLRLETLEDYKNKQRVDQCMHGAVDENKCPIQKATALGSNVKWNRTALRCSGHGGKQHAHLQGQGRTRTWRSCQDCICSSLPQVDVSADETGHNQLPIWTEADECEEVANGHDLPHRGSLLRLHQVPVGTVLSQRHSTHSCATRMSTWTMGSRNRSES